MRRAVAVGRRSKPSKSRRPGRPPHEALNVSSAIAWSIKPAQKARTCRRPKRWQTSGLSRLRSPRYCCFSRQAAESRRHCSSCASSLRWVASSLRAVTNSGSSRCGPVGKTPPACREALNRFCSIRCSLRRGACSRWALAASALSFMKRQNCLTARASPAAIWGSERKAWGPRIGACGRYCPDVFAFFRHCSELRMLLSSSFNSRRWVIFSLSVLARSDSALEATFLRLGDIEILHERSTQVDDILTPSIEKRISGPTCNLQLFFRSVAWRRLAG